MDQPMNHHPRTTTSPAVTTLADPLVNKGTAFSREERARLGLDGLLPPAVETLDEQVARAYEAFRGYDKPLNRHIYLRQLQDTNEVLFYRLVTEYLEELLPVVYTPTVGEACQRFSEIYRRPRGLFLSWEDRHRFQDILRNRPYPDHDVDVIVVTDGQRILGLGDQGVGGMGIPIGKLSLYTAIGGIHPARTLPVLLDVGTDNEALLDNPRYLGRRDRRLTGAEYDEMIEAFVSAVEAELPGTLLQWEDFATAHAHPILARYRDRLLTFNDDIQGTAAVALGALSTAADVAGTPLPDQRLVILGAGSAAIGVADMIRTAMVDEGLSEDEATARFWILDVDGLLVRSRDELTPQQRVFARDDSEVTDWDGTGLAEVVRRVEPTALIGLSTAHGAFTEEIVRQMASTCERPVVFPLSNPTSHSEAEPADLTRWTDGRALIATGSPFPPLTVDGHEVPVAQSNNVYVFPAMGLAVTASRATRVTDRMLVAAARAVAECAVQAADGVDGPVPLLPPLTGMRDSAREIALAAALAAVEDGVAPHATEEELRKAVAQAQWTPRYEV
ncbi:MULTISPECIES: NAD-dependent malic enzyme [Streptomyces]|uniref:NAD-dependent malic enzyme n=1 Tax=Streptomyces koelreuteriae TaxID=2838015 RepID=A0ABX8G291_9ACTN|nr:MULTISPECIES: NAD-dependent malic enzyme [Streptomyces]QWB27628.1 NAD-dependent malic enzyme [Streptomyces koelreuteriae]UUA10723.1 NAD-dependent malic enzyme [Streptomyces koelreuteriae]UUA18330.1 NAD-dependent malic enzyme [Streptomyces sp. CRCS-T-1]